MHRYLGFDPGTPPCVAVVDFDRSGKVLDMRFYEGNKVAVEGVHKTPSGRIAKHFLNSPKLLHEVVQDEAPTLAIIEKVGIRPGENIASGVKFVGSMYMMAGICTAMNIPVHSPMPAVWKKALGLPGKARPDAHELIRQRALVEFPDFAHLFKLKKHHNRAEAALLCLWKWHRGFAPGFVA